MVECKSHSLDKIRTKLGLTFVRGVVFSNANKNWKKSRTSVLSVLAPSRVNEFTDLLLYETDNMVNELLGRTSRNGQLNSLTTINACALNVVLTIIFGRRVTSADDPFLKVCCLASVGFKLPLTKLFLIGTDEVH
jgi:hypothetical protein